MNPTGNHGDTAADTNLGAITTLQEFLTTTGGLTVEERRLIVDQALLLIEQFYVHLPLKRAMHAADPVQRLKLLRYRLDTMPEERRFHHDTNPISSCPRRPHPPVFLFVLFPV